MRNRIKRIHVNKHIIGRNNKTGERNPVITAKVGRENHYGDEVEVLGPSRIIYSHDKPLSCGAKVWIETTSTIKVDGKEIT